MTKEKFGRSETRTEFTRCLNNQTMKSLKQEKENKIRIPWLNKGLIKGIKLD